MDVSISPTVKINGSFSLPGDKSISHRILILAALARGTSAIYNLSSGRDVQSTLNCLKNLGVDITEDDNRLLVTGKPISTWSPPPAPLNAGNSGTTIRLLSGILSALPFPVEIYGDESLNKRPMKRIIEPLTSMGARIKSEDGFPPLKFFPGSLTDLVYHSPVSSAQVKSCLLLAGLVSGQSVKITEPYKSRDHTERLFRFLSLPVSVNNNTILIQPPYPDIPSFDYHIPGDPSSAAYFAALCALLGNGSIRLNNILLNPTRTAFFSVLRQMGAKVEFLNRRTEADEPLGDIRISAKVFRAVKLSGGKIPLLIDELPLIALLATRCHGISEIKDAGELRVKESDRIKTVTENLKISGADITELPDGFLVKGPAQLKPVSWDSFGDHRIAMAGAIAASAAPSGAIIRNAECVNISFPDFFSILEKVKA